MLKTCKLRILLSASLPLPHHLIRPFTTTAPVTPLQVTSHLVVSPYSLQPAGPATYHPISRASQLYRLLILVALEDNKSTPAYLVKILKVLVKPHLTHTAAQLPILLDLQVDTLPLLSLKRYTKLSFRQRTMIILHNKRLKYRRRPNRR